MAVAPSLTTLTAAATPGGGRAVAAAAGGQRGAHEPEFPALTHAAAEMSNVAARFGPDR